MLTTLRRGPGDEPSRDLRSLLLACHERIRHFTGVARRLGEAVTATPEDVAQACRVVHRYFTVSLPLHVEDEERSLLPRLTANPPPPELRRALEDMRGEHAATEKILAEALPIWAEVAEDPARWAPQRARLAWAARKLDEVFSAHLLIEETFIFPDLDRLLTPAARDEILDEMRARRAPPAG
jgi:hypothetical protein